MTHLNGPLGGLDVPLAEREASPNVEDCPRCLAHTGGALSVKLLRAGRISKLRTALAADPSDEEPSPSVVVATLLRQLRPSCARR